MPTAKKRINLSVDDALYEQLEELQEDLYFAKIAAQREKEKEISHEEVWN